MHFIIYILLLVFITLTSPLQAQVIQDQTTGITVGRAAKQLGPNSIGDSGPAVGGPPGSGLTELGITNSGPCGLGITSGAITVGYAQICAGFVGGNYTLTFSSVGVSTPGLNFILNGTTYAFPFTIGGIVGPVSTTVNDVACWNNTIGTLLKDCGPSTLYTPAITCNTGSPAGNTFGSYKTFGKMVFVEGSVLFTAGTCAGNLFVSVPIAHAIGANIPGGVCSGNYLPNPVGVMLAVAGIAAGDNRITILKYDGSFPGLAVGDVWTFSCVYQSS